MILFHCPNVALSEQLGGLGDDAIFFGMDSSNRFKYCNTPPAIVGFWQLLDVRFVRIADIGAM